MLDKMGNGLRQENSISSADSPCEISFLHESTRQHIKRDRELRNEVLSWKDALGTPLYQDVIRLSDNSEKEDPAYLLKREEYPDHIARLVYNPLSGVSGYRHNSTEINVHENLSHPALPKAVKACDIPALDCKLFIRESAPGKSLRQILDQGPLPSAQVISLLKQMTEILDFIHTPERHPMLDRCVLHRDIKPANIILDQDSNLQNSGVYLVDFGIAKEGRDGTLTLTTQVRGTPNYMAIEHLSGFASRASDIYSLGVTSIEALLGAIPPKLRANYDSQFPFILTSDCGIPQGLCNVLNKMVFPTERGRYGSAAELRKDLNQLDDQGNVLSSEDSTERSPLPIGIEESQTRDRDSLLSRAAWYIGLYYHESGDSYVERGQPLDTLEDIKNFQLPIEQICSRVIFGVLYFPTLVRGEFSRMIYVSLLKDEACDKKELSQSEKMKWIKSVENIDVGSILTLGFTFTATVFYMLVSLSIEPIGFYTLAATNLLSLSFECARLAKRAIKTILFGHPNKSNKANDQISTIVDRPPLSNEPLHSSVGIQVELQKDNMSKAEIASIQRATKEVMYEEQQSKDNLKLRMKEVKRTLKLLLKDPVIQALQAFCNATGTNIPCTPLWYYVVTSETGTSAASERRIALTGNGFRIVSKYEWRKEEPFKELAFPYNRLLSQGIKRVVVKGATAESIKAELYKAAKELNDRVNQKSSTVGL